MKGSFCIRKCILAVLMLSLLLSACTTNSQAPASPLRVGWSDWAGDYVFVLAEKLGLYEKNGIQVELVYLPSYQQVVTRFAANVVDTANIQMGDILLLSQSVENFSAVAALDSSEGADVVVAVQWITSPADLKGKRFGVRVGSVMGELFFEEMLKKYGLKPGDLTVVDILPENVPASLGIEIDAGHTWAPYDQLAVDMGYRSIFTSADTPALFPDLVPFRDDFVASRPDDVRAFVAAIMEAVDYWLKNPDQGSALIADYLTELAASDSSIVAVPAEDISLQGVRLFSLTDNLELLQPEKGAMFTTARITLDYMIRSGRISHTPDLEKYFIPSFLATEPEK